MHKKRETNVENTEPDQGMPEFADVYQRWRNWEITQPQAARELGVAQSTFSRLKGIYESENGLEPRGPKPAPAGFDEVFHLYQDHKVTCREAGQMLGVSHAEFLVHVKRARAEEAGLPPTSNPGARPRSLEDAVAVEGFENVYRRWRNHEVTMTEAGRELGFSASTFHNLKAAYERENGLDPRPPKSEVRDMPER